MFYLLNSHKTEVDCRAACILLAPLQALFNQGFLQEHIHPKQFQLQQQEFQLFWQETASYSTELGILFQHSTSLSPLVTIPVQEPSSGSQLLPSSIVFIVTDCFAISTSTSKISPSELCSLIEGIYKRRTVIFTRYSADVISSADSKMGITTAAESVSSQQQIGQCHLRHTQIIHCLNQQP